MWKTNEAHSSVAQEKKLIYVIGSRENVKDS